MNFDFHRLFTPSAWIQSTPTDWEWDKQLNALLDTNPRVISLDEFHVELEVAENKSIELWVANYPYAYGFPYSYSSRLLPSYKTRKRLKNYLMPLTKN